MAATILRRRLCLRLPKERDGKRTSRDRASVTGARRELEMAYACGNPSASICRQPNSIKGNRRIIPRIAHQALGRVEWLCEHR